ncbi:MAG: AmmeMemoRadiSam system protein [Parcubacteria group bacterium]|nr:AmmeMemoRadiSam system protein [Parcubacteria group bacterium]
MSKKVLAASVLIALAALGGRYAYTTTTRVEESTIFAAVVPHHDLVAGARAEFFSELAKRITPPKTIILISPNHYDAGQGRIQTTDEIWHLADGDIPPDQSVISSLVRTKLVTKEPSSFTNEHGIYNILGDIHANFPNALLVPLIFEHATEDELLELEKSLEATCKDCLMIASVDFSHYQPALLGELHDDRSIRDLEALDTNDVLTGAEVDSGPALALLTLWAKDHGTLHFALQNHTNSGIIYKDPDMESTTHVFGWYEAGEKTEPEKQVSFIIGGDMMFARLVNHTFKNNFNDVFKDLGDRVFWGTDASFINLEGAITNGPIEDGVVSDDLTFKFSPDIVKTLSFLHITGASLANNHSNNAGAEGLDTTRTLLHAANIQAFGGPTESSVAKTAEFKGEGMMLEVIGINLTFPNQDPASIVPLIQKFKKDPSTRVLVMPHWGIEYSTMHTSEQASAAHSWIDAGADMVVGSHPHVIEDTELYRGKPIIYSLGNLLFDQFAPGTQTGLLIAGKFTPEGLTFFALPSQSLHLYPRLMTGMAKQNVLTSIYVPFARYLTETPAGTVVQLPN